MVTGSHLLTVPNTDSGESAHLLSAGLYLALNKLPPDPLQALRNSPPTSPDLQTLPPGSVGSASLSPDSALALSHSSAIYCIHGTPEHYTP